jgi:hemoglobin
MSIDAGRGTGWAIKLRGSPVTDGTESAPSLAQWAGGEEAISRLFARFYERVPSHPLLAPIFAAMSAHHAERVAAFVAEVLGGDKRYSVAGGTHARMIGRHIGRHLSQEQRRAWVSLLLETADEVGLPDDPEFRASLVGYLEWGSRLAVINSREERASADTGAPMPSWTWSSPGGPYRP